MNITKLISNPSIWNLFFKFLTMGAKLLLSTFVLVFISTEDFGIYVIIAKTLTIAIILLGFDFYTYSQRDILQGDTHEQGNKIRDQFVFYFINYLIFLPLFYLLFVFERVSIEYIFWFYALLVLDHLSQEIYRILLVFKRPIVASALFFIKVGVWILPLFALWMLGYDNLKNIKSILMFWTAFELLSIFFGLLFIKKLPFTINFTKEVNWDWVKKGVIICFPFFIGTIASNVIEFADIYMIKAHFGKNGDFQNGIYGFFVNMGNIVQMFVQSAILIVFAPKLIESFSEDKTKYNKLHMQMTKQNIFASFLFAIVVFVFIYPLIKFLGKTEIESHYSLIFILVGAKVLFNISMIYHYHLYVRHYDKKIMITMIIAAIVNVVLNIFLIPIYGIYGAAYATLASFILILILKFIFAQKILKKEN